MNTTTGAQRYNKRMSKIFESYKNDSLTVNGITLPRHIIDSVKSHAYYVDHYNKFCDDEATGSRTYTGNFTKDELVKSMRNFENDLMWQMHKLLTPKS